MTVYRVVKRDQPKIVMRQCRSLEDAGNHIFDERTFVEWKVLAAETANGRPRDLTRSEKLRLERILYPSLYE